MPNLSQELLELCRSVTAKRPKTVIDHILAHGFVTTEQLKELYGYNHPPRAVRDVREQGIPLETFRVVGSDGRKIAAYRFGELKSEGLRKLSGRTNLSKHIKSALIKQYGGRCFIYLEEIPERELQIDHRIPYEVIGDDVQTEPNPHNFMLLCGSANRAKSWSCEHCENWQTLKNPKICETCYWAFPESYSHVAMRQLRHLHVMWQEDEVVIYDRLKTEAERLGKELPSFVKEILAKIADKPQ